MVESAAHQPKEFISTEASVHYIDAKDSFGQLEQREALYAYYMTRASWEGSKICWF